MSTAESWPTFCERSWRVSSRSGRARCFCRKRAAFPRRLRAADPVHPLSRAGDRENPADPGAGAGGRGAVPAAPDRGRGQGGRGSGAPPGAGAGDPPPGRQHHIDAGLAREALPLPPPGGRRHRPPHASQSGRGLCGRGAGSGPHRVGYPRPHLRHPPPGLRSASPPRPGVRTGGGRRLLSDRDDGRRLPSRRALFRTRNGLGLLRRARPDLGQGTRGAPGLPPSGNTGGRRPPAGPARRDTGALLRKRPPRPLRCHPDLERSRSNREDSFDARPRPRRGGHPGRRRQHRCHGRRRSGRRDSGPGGPPAPLRPDERRRRRWS